LLTIYARQLSLSFAAASESGDEELGSAKPWLSNILYALIFSGQVVREIRFGIDARLRT
jgi:hypothetical protein